MAAVFNVHVRTGCFCNTGACQDFLGISNEQMKKNLQAGHVCGDSVDLVDGQPTGSVRVSFGYMSTFEDCQNFLNFVAECFVEKPATADPIRLQELRAGGAKRSPFEEVLDGRNHEPAETKSTGGPREGQGLLKVPGDALTLTNIYIYPVKSCAALEVQEWPVGRQGLRFDRVWMVVDGHGVSLSQKREPRLCLIRPRVHLASSRLLLRASGMDGVSVPLECDAQPAASRTCRSKVCGDRVDTLDCGDEAASWLSEFLGRTCRLIRQRPDFARGSETRPAEGSESLKEPCATAPAAPPLLSLVNEAQYLLISRGSVQLLLGLMSSRQDSSQGNQLLDTESLVRRFRANLVIAGAEPLEEDNWSHLVIGGSRFTVTGQCGRCQMIGIDQDTGTRTKEPLLSLSACRSGKVTFGVYLTHDGPEDSAAAQVLSAGSLVQPETPS